jgi:hypothetical protein
MTNIEGDEAVTKVRAAQSAPEATASKKGAKRVKGAPQSRHTANRGKAKATRQKEQIKAPRQDSKKAKVLGLLGRKEGATLAQMMKATGWQAHSVRGFLSGALGKKMGLKIESQKRENGDRIYLLTK